MKTAPSAPHVILVSFCGQGNVSPVLRLAKRLAAKGLLVTYSSNMYVGHGIFGASKAEAVLTPTSLDAPPLPIGKGLLRFEFFADGWDVEDPRRRVFTEAPALLHQLRTVGAANFADIVRRQADQGRPVSCIIHDVMVPWVPDIAFQLGIPSAILWIQSCSVFSLYYHFSRNLVEFPHSPVDPVRVSLPGMPTLKSDEVPTFLLESNPYKALANAIRAQFNSLDRETWVLVNSFEELEHDVIDAVSKFMPIIAVGPLVDGSESTAANGNDIISGALWKVSHESLEWLDKQEPNSVVFVSVGSNLQLAREDMAELAKGLLTCGFPFLWVVRDDSRHLLPDGFVEEAEGKGMVVSWTSQERVLAHPATACFVSHCGWNSTLEILRAGVPVVAFPHHADQLTNAKYLVEIWGVGASLRSPPTAEEMNKCIQEVVTSEKAKTIKAKALEWMGVAKTATEEGGSSDRSIQAFVDDLASRVAAAVAKPLP